MTQPLAVFNRIDEQGRYLDSVYYNQPTYGQFDTHSYSVLKAETEISYPKPPYKMLESLCLAQEYALDQGFNLAYATLIREGTDK